MNGKVISHIREELEAEMESGLELLILDTTTSSTLDLDARTDVESGGSEGKKSDTVVLFFFDHKIS
jgi:hypothetical protein